jgi:hypothetical protein
MRVEDRHTGNPARDQGPEPLPSHAAPLAPSPKRTVPAPDDLGPIAVQTIQIAGYGVVVEVALYDRPQPLPDLGHWLVPASTKLLLQLFQLGGESLPDRPALDDEPTGLPGPPTEVGEPKKVEYFRFASPRCFRFSAAWRPNSIRRVLSGCNSNPNFRRRSFHSWRNRSASARCSNPLTISSAYRTTMTSPVA